MNSAKEKPVRKPVRLPPPSQPPIAPVTGNEDWSAYGELVRLKGGEG